MTKEPNPQLPLFARPPELKERPLAEWAFWRDHDGVEDALTTHYPVTFRTDAILQNASLQLATALTALDGRMRQLAEESAQQRVGP